jgi:hypothetical protein
MSTLTIRNLSPKLVRSLKSLSERNQRSMEQEVRVMLEEHVGDRMSALGQIEESWKRQSRRPKAKEVDRWIKAGRE